MVWNERTFTNQAAGEIRTSELLRDQDLDNSRNVVHLLKHFTFREHVCMTFELLNMNLYDCFERQRNINTCIQSRFYRTPKVMLCCRYNVSIDIGGFGCILAELLTGKCDVIAWQLRIRPMLVSYLMQTANLPHVGILIRESEL
ncbi:unnamed protein product [Mesocestoides corti]|uniref:Protein kinase domain-containing protein n=1 Tax=Mesocestoides corti TaxID=53468 RepID=A0A0R3URI4_MESCO|nr:unnamed protein product [Mesocestoides corti]